MDFLNMKHITFGDKRVSELKIGDTIVWNGLPKGYKELEYIGTTGTQYIDTGFIPNQDTRVICEFMFKGNNSTRDIYGSRITTNNSNYWLRVISSAWQPGYNKQLGGTGIASDTTKWHIADQNKNMFYIDGVLGYEFTYSNFQAPLTLIFGGGQSTSNGHTFYSGKARYRAFKIFDNNNLVRNFLPCKDPNDNIGMYDTVNQQFHGNAGTGDFEAGPEWNGLPLGYKKLDYIETTGTQYIDTGFIPDQDSRIVCEFMYFDGNGIYGTRISTSSNNFAFRVASSKWQPGYLTLGNTGIASDTTKWHVADQNKNLFYFDNELAYTFTYNTFKAPKSIVLGGINANNKMYYGKGRYRSCKIYDNNILIRDFIPCKKPNGEVGMYDLLNGCFYSNAGEDKFIAGKEV